jgi:hypothetical protein
MSNNLGEVGYAKITSLVLDPVTGLPTGEEKYRIVDVLVSTSKDQIVEPYFFMYSYGTVNKSMSYKLPLEGLNYKEVQDNTRDIVGSTSKRYNTILNYSNQLYFPQLAPCEYVYSDIPPISYDRPEVFDLTTGTEEVSPNGQESVGRIYLMLNKGETSLQLYKRSYDLDNPHNENVKLLLEDIVLERPELELRSIVLSLSADEAEVDYSLDLFKNRLSNPVKWLASPKVKMTRSLPSIDRIRELESNRVQVSSDNLLVNGYIIGKKASSVLDLRYTENDISITINSDRISINGIHATNGKHF